MIQPPHALEISLSAWILDSMAQQMESPDRRPYDVRSAAQHEEEERDEDKKMDNVLLRPRRERDRREQQVAKHVHGEDRRRKLAEKTLIGRGKRQGEEPAQKAGEGADDQGWLKREEKRDGERERAQTFMPRLAGSQTRSDVTWKVLRPLSCNCC